MLLEKAIFLNKDGTLFEKIPYNIDPSKHFFSQGAEKILSTFRDDYQFHVLSNMSGLALGHFKEQELVHLKEKISEMFLEVGGRLTGFHYCPHHPQGIVPEYTSLCGCRRPGTYLLENASRLHGVSLYRSWVITDDLDDIEAGKRVRCRTIFIDNKNENEKQWTLNEWRRPDFVAHDLYEASELVITEEANA